MLQKLVDEDIAQAAGALASTLETAAKGIVYEHQPASLVAARLMVELKGVVDEVVKNAGSTLERDAAIALRRIEHAAKMMVTVRPDTNEFQQLLARVLAPAAGRRRAGGLRAGVLASSCRLADVRSAATVRRANLPVHRSLPVNGQLYGIMQVPSGRK